MAAGLGKQIAQEMTGFAKNLYHGAVKGVNKADDTVVKAMAKSNSSKNLKYAKGNRAVKASNNVKAPNRKTPNKRNFQSLPQSKSNTVGANLGNWAGGGTRDSLKTYKKMADNEKSILGAIKQGHQKIGADGTAQYDMGKIAGTTFTVGVAGRIATGGGLYRDRYGNTNLPGIPFI